MSNFFGYYMILKRVRRPSVKQCPLHSQARICLQGGFEKSHSKCRMDEMKTVELNISAKHIGHQLQNGGRTCKEDALKDE
jgi:hypothetical protein